MRLADIAFLLVITALAIFNGILFAERGTGAGDKSMLASGSVQVRAMDTAPGDSR
jgi:hypothetical protein